MTRKRRRLYILVAAMSALAVATALMLAAFQDNLVFFYTPSDAAANNVAPGTPFRLGGLVEQGSVKRLPDGMTVEFTVTDTAQRMNVTYKGVLPDLFREGQGVVAEGRLREDGTFVARDVLAKHDENYMPPEVAKALKEKGLFQHETGSLMPADAKNGTAVR
jgi:cytochrome c-type biogenesis protein CcmE